MTTLKHHKMKLATLGLLAAAAIGLRAEADKGPAILPPPPALTAPAAAGLESLFVNVADHTMPSVANIFTTKAMPRLRRSRPGPPDGMYDIWRDFFGEEAPQGAQRPMALGTGFVVEAYEGGGGLVLTNNHVIANADEVKVKFTENDDERESPADVVGTDPELDVALLRVKTSRTLRAVALGDSDRLKVGEWIAAIGNPFGHGHSVSHGIVSAKARALPGGFGQYLQVDAPINPGNSGGPLVNLAGEVVGINNAIDARGSGIGFAIPINAVKLVLPQLKREGRVERGYIGLAVAPARDTEGPIVAEVVPGQPAAQAGLRKDDVIVKIDDKAVRSPSALVDAIANTPVGRMVTAEIVRDGHTLHKQVRVARRPDLRQASLDE